MEHEKVFFSYSRADSDFALRLAGDLKAAGVPVWIDQRDIRGGSRWDKVIEDALEAASKVIVLLSPASVSSDNVRDEVAWALKAGKTVIPILAENCTPFLRIISLHTIDFTGSYSRGLEELYETLGVSLPEKAAASAESKTDAEAEPVGAGFVEKKPEKAATQEDKPAGQPVAESTYYTAPATAMQPERVFDAANKKYSLRMIGWGALTGLVSTPVFFGSLIAKEDIIKSSHGSISPPLISVILLGSLLLKTAQKKTFLWQVFFVFLSALIFMLSDYILVLWTAENTSEEIVIPLMLLRGFFFGGLIFIAYKKLVVKSEKSYTGLLRALLLSVAATLLAFWVLDNLYNIPIKSLYYGRNAGMLVFMPPLFHFFFHPLLVYAVLKSAVDSRNAAAKLR